uniref:protein FAM83G-like isoform X2 n=1 Tax=Myxine glutinosa TaxID=7769 RepID=UPI00358EFE90
MALSQEMCLADRNVNWIANDSKPEFFYSEVQRLALEALIDSGLDAYQERLKKENIRNFLSNDELERVRLGMRTIWTGGKSAGESKEEPDTEEPGGHKTSQSTLTYWPERSDDEDPSTLDLGWTDRESYRGVTRATVYTQPAAEGAASIKETVRRIVQHAQSRMRVRSLAGTCLRTHSGKEVEGFMKQKFMIVDGDKAMTGTYSFTWTSSRLDRNIITVLTGQVVDTFDQEFRTLYDLSKPVSLESLGLPPDPQPNKPEEPSSKAPVSTEVSRRLLNPKYALVSNNNNVKAAAKMAVQKENTAIIPAPLVKTPKSPGHTTPSPTTRDFAAIDLWVCKAAAPHKDTDNIFEMIIIPECLEPYNTVTPKVSLPKPLGVKVQPATGRDERDSKEPHPAEAKHEQHSSRGKLQNVSPIKDANKTTMTQQSFQLQQPPESRGRCGEHGNKERTWQSKTSISKEGQVLFEGDGMSIKKLAKSTEVMGQPIHSAKGRQEKDSSSHRRHTSRESNGSKPQSCSPKRQESPTSKRNPRTGFISGPSEGHTSRQSRLDSVESRSPKRQESSASKQNPRTGFISGPSEGHTSRQSRLDSVESRSPKRQESSASKQNPRTRLISGSSEGHTFRQSRHHSIESAQQPCSLKKKENITMVNGPASHEPEERNKEIGDEATAAATVLPADGECSNEREFENGGATSAINCNHTEAIGELEPETAGLGHRSSDGEVKMSTLPMGAVVALEEDCLSGDDSPMASVRAITHNSEATNPRPNSTGTDELSFHSASGSYEPKTDKELSRYWKPQQQFRPNKTPAAALFRDRMTHLDYENASNNSGGPRRHSVDYHPAFRSSSPNRHCRREYHSNAGAGVMSSVAQTRPPRGVKASLLDPYNSSGLYSDRKRHLHRPSSPLWQRRNNQSKASSGINIGHTSYTREKSKM